MDSRWLEQCREGNLAAIEKMVHIYQKDVYRLALSILDDSDEAEDGTQETFIAALRTLDSFRADSTYKTWLFSITINVCLSRLRRSNSQFRMRQTLQNIFRIRSKDDLPESSAITNQDNDQIWRAIHTLNNKYRLPVILRYYHNLSTAEISKLLNIPSGTVHSRLNHARGKLRALLKEEEI